MKCAIVAALLTGAASQGGEGKCCDPQHDDGCTDCKPPTDWCSATQHNCEGTCKSKWCPVGPPTPTSSPTVAPTPAPTLPTPPPPPTPPTPDNCESMAKKMNDEFYGFDPTDPSGPLGVYIRKTSNPTIYCHLGCGGQGGPDCRVSGSVWNHAQMIKQEGGKTVISPGYGNVGGTGWYVNMDKFRQKLNKCSYQLDGGTMFKYNFGCACAAVGRTCDDKSSAYFNLDKATGYTTNLTYNSPDMQECQSRLYKGAAFWKATGYINDDTHAMLAARVARGSQLDSYNEAVLDAEALIEELQAEDQSKTISAVVYFGPGPQRQAAKNLASQLQDNWSGKHTAAIVKVNMDANIDNKEPIFSCESDEDEVVV